VQKNCKEITFQHVIVVNFDALYFKYVQLVWSTFDTKNSPSIIRPAIFSIPAISIPTALNFKENVRVESRENKNKTRSSRSFGRRQLLVFDEVGRQSFYSAPADDHRPELPACLPSWPARDHAFSSRWRETTPSRDVFSRS